MASMINSPHLDSAGGNHASTETSVLGHRRGSDEVVYDINNCLGYAVSLHTEFMPNLSCLARYNLAVFSFLLKFPDSVKQCVTSSLDMLTLLSNLGKPWI